MPLYVLAYIRSTARISEIREFSRSKLCMFFWYWNRNRRSVGRSTKYEISCVCELKMMQQQITTSLLTQSNGTATAAAWLLPSMHAIATTHRRTAGEWVRMTRLLLSYVRTLRWRIEANNCVWVSSVRPSVHRMVACLLWFFSGEERERERKKRDSSHPRSKRVSSRSPPSRFWGRKKKERSRKNFFFFSSSSSSSPPSNGGKIAAQQFTLFTAEYS